MRPFACLVGAMSLVALAGSGAAQPRPDFSGAWVRAVDSTVASPVAVATVGDARFRTGTMGSGWGSPLTIGQQPDQLSIEWPHFSSYDLQPPIRLVYALDESESRNSLMLGHASSEQRARVAWDVSRLVITTTSPAPGAGDARAMTAETRHVLWLESPTLLVVETTRVGVHGGSTSTVLTRYARR